MKETIYPESVLRKYLHDEFESGITLAADPENAGLQDLYVRTTTIHSPWYTQVCKVCGHRFREGDRVRLCPQCHTPYHDDHQYELHCWQAHFKAHEICTAGGIDRISEIEIPACSYSWDGRLPDEPPPDSAAALPQMQFDQRIVARFVAGLEKVWRPFGEHHSFKVAPGSPLVGRKCPWCRFTIRAGDWVIKCPCGRDCGTYFHQDIFRHLTCWNEWNGIEGHNYCPTTGAPYQQHEQPEEA